MNNSTPPMPKPSGTEIIDAKFEYYLNRYLNLHFKSFHNNYDFGEWFIKFIVDQVQDTKIPNKYQFIRGIRWTMKDFNVEKYWKEMKKKDKEEE